MTINNRTINLPQLKQDRRAIEERIREVKTVLRSPWPAKPETPMWKFQYELIKLKKEATGLCILRAWMRGRNHLPDVAYCKEIAEREAPQYAREEEEEVAA